MVCKGPVPTLGRDKVRTLRLWVVGDGGGAGPVQLCEGRIYELSLEHITAETAPRFPLLKSTVP